MLFGYNKNKGEDYRKHYIDARRKIDILCGLIVSGRLRRKEAEEIYGEIQSAFERADRENLELFKMIYENRVRRLCDQFCPE
jgi:predicted site-specific integrase-resolvase